MTPAHEALTIVLTLKDRTPFTYRWMRYMNDVRCPYPILIADGGKDAGVETHLRQSENYPNLTYTYVRYPLDRDYETFYRKFADVVGRVTTPYVLLADNDDFFFLEHVPAFLAFLDREERYVSCGGQRIALRLLSTNEAVVNAPSAGQYAARTDIRPKSVTDETGVDRLCYFLAHVVDDGLWSSWYHVHRTAAVKDAADFVYHHRFTDPVAHEIHMHFRLLLAGKYQQLDVPFWVVQLGSSQLTAALEARGTVVDRFVAANSVADLHQSLAACPSLLPAERERVHSAISDWLSRFAIKLNTPPGVAVPPTITERLAGRMTRLFKPNAAAPPLRLPALEKYILDPAP